LAHLCRWKKHNICQSIWHKSEELWRTCWGTHWELEEHIENLMRTHWKLKENIVGTHWEPGRNFSCQRVHHHFWHGLIPLAKNTCCDHLNWFMGAFYFIFWKSHIHSPIIIFFGTLSTPEWKHLFGPQLQNRNKCIPLIAHLFSLYKWELNFGQTIWIKRSYYWEHLGERIWKQFRNWMEPRGKIIKPHGNTLRTKEKNPSPPCRLSKRKKLDCSWVYAEPSCWLHDISLSKTVRHHFSPGLILPKSWGTF